MPRLRPYRVFVRMAVREAMAFRVDFWGTVCLSGLTLLLSYYLWTAVYGGRDELAGLGIQEMMTYIVVSALVNGALVGGTITRVGAGYVSGAFAGDLIRPLSFPLICLARTVGSSTVYFLLRGLPVFVVGALTLDVLWPSPWAAAVFVASLVQALILYFVIEFTIAQLTLFTESYRAAGQLFGLLVTFASGALIPLPFFPEQLKQILYALPFQAIFYLPINTFLEAGLEAGPVPGALIAAGVSPLVAALASQTLWIAVLAPIAAVCWRLSSPRLLVQGG